MKITAHMKGSTSTPKYAHMVRYEGCGPAILQSLVPNDLLGVSSRVRREKLQLPCLFLGCVVTLSLICHILPPAYGVILMAVPDWMFLGEKDCAVCVAVFGSSVLAYLPCFCNFITSATLFISYSIPSESTLAKVFDV